MAVLKGTKPEKQTGRSFNLTALKCIPLVFSKTYRRNLSNLYALNPAHHTCQKPAPPAKIPGISSQEPVKFTASILYKTNNTEHPNRAAKIK